MIYAMLKIRAGVNETLGVSKNPDIFYYYVIIVSNLLHFSAS